MQTARLRRTHQKQSPRSRRTTWGMEIKVKGADGKRIRILGDQRTGKTQFRQFNVRISRRFYEELEKILEAEPQPTQMRDLLAEAFFLWWQFRLIDYEKRKKRMRLWLKRIG